MNDLSQRIRDLISPQMSLRGGENLWRIYFDVFLASLRFFRNGNFDEKSCYCRPIGGVNMRGGGLRQGIRKILGGHRKSLRVLEAGRGRCRGGSV